ncbi:GATA binding protein 2, partial [Mycena sanguinolenta]
CSNCGKLTSPIWRRDSNTGRTLCNACGLYQQQRHVPRPQTLIDADNDGDEEESSISNGPQCSHCGTCKTSVWRRNKDGEEVCNTCG